MLQDETFLLMSELSLKGFNYSIFPLSVNKMELLIITGNTP